MLRREVVDAVEKGRFHIYAVSTIDEGMEVLTGVAAGGRREDGTYPEETVNYQVNEQLQGMAARLRHFYGPTTEEKQETHS
jgi:predicted ATP-dependent protease